MRRSFKMPREKRPFAGAPREKRREFAFPDDAAPIRDHEKSYTVADDPWSAFGWNEPKREDDLGIDDFREMMREEPQVRLSVEFKILARLSTGYDIVPHSDDDMDVEVAKFVRDQFGGICGTFTGFMRRAMRALPYGQSIHEIVYYPITSGEWAGKWGLRKLQVKKPELFWPKPDKFGNLEDLMHRPNKIERNWATLDADYFVIWYPENEGDYIPRPELKPAYRWYKIKQLISRIWPLYLDKFASPTPIAEHPNNAGDDQKEAMLGFLKKMRTSNAAVFPKDWDVSLLEAMRQSGGDYEICMKYCDKMISRAILLPSLIADEGDSGAYSLGRQHADNFQWVLDALGEELSKEIVGDQIIRRIVDPNFEVAHYPTLKWRPYTKVDLVALAKAFTVLEKTGIIDPREKWLRERADLPAWDPDNLEDRDLPLPRTAAKGGPPPESDPPTPDKRDANLAAPGKIKWDPLKHDKKVDYTAMEREITSHEATARTELSATVRLMRDDLVKDLKRQGVENSPTSMVNSLKLRHVPAFRSSLEWLMAHMSHAGAYSSRREVEKRLGPVPLPPTMGKEFAAAEDEVRIPVKESIAEVWAGKVPIQRHLLKIYHSKAFTISGVFRDDVLGKCKVAIQSGMERGATFREIEREINSIFKPFLTEPGALDIGVAQPYRVENIVRTNGMNAYNVGRRNMLEAPEIWQHLVAMEYSAILDERTTDFCNSWHGEILEIDDPRVRINWPPNHYQCRSIWVEILRGETWMASPKPPAIEPMEGFRLTICCDRAA